MPGAEHDPVRARAVQLEFVHGGAVGMAVDQPLHAAGTHGRAHGQFIRIHDGARGPARVAPAARARLLCELAPQAQRQSQETPLPVGLSHHRAQQLIGPICRAQRVAMGEQDALPVQVDQHGIGEQAGTTALLEAVLEQEVAIAVHDEAGHAALAQVPHGRADLAPMRIVIIIADPGLEQIPEDVERLGACRPRLEELDELPPRGGLLRIEVQIGDKQRGQLVSLAARDLGYIVKMNPSPVVTRFAPSPSGELHLGNARTALFNFLLARARGGRFVLRVEDTDSSRTQERYVEALCTDLSWMGLHWDEGPDRPGPHGPYRQSQRGEIYQRYVEQLEREQRVYPCFCTPLELDLSRRAQLAAGRPPRYAGTCRTLSAQETAARRAQGLGASLRFRVPLGQRLDFQDLVHGAQSFLSDDIGDFIVRREDGSAAFFFSNAVDDALMQVSHVLRGDDHLSNTPRQRLLLEALGLPAPQYGHVSLLIGPDGAPLSKRHGATSVRELREAGYSAAAVGNHLFRLGHSTPLNGLLTLEQMVSGFEVSALQRAPAHFELGQLRHWQSEWVHALSFEQAREWLAWALPAGLDDARASAFITAVLPNVVLAEDARLWQQIIFGEALAYDEPALRAAREAGPEFFSAAAGAVHEPADLGALRGATGRKGAAFFMPLRAALTGRLHGPELAPLLAAMPAERVRERLLQFAQARP